MNPNITILRDITYMSKIYSKLKIKALLVTDGINNAIVTYPENKFTESQVATILKDCKIIKHDNIFDFRVQVVFK